MQSYPTEKVVNVVSKAAAKNVMFKAKLPFSFLRFARITSSIDICKALYSVVQSKFTATITVGDLLFFENLWPGYI